MINPGVSSFTGVDVLLWNCEVEVKEERIGGIM